MKIVMFENGNAIFDFELPDVIDRLEYYSDQNVHEATDLLDTIALCPSSAIKANSDYFGYTVLSLLKVGKGSIFCKPCKKGFRTQRGSSCRTCLSCRFFKFIANWENVFFAFVIFLSLISDHNSSFPIISPLIRIP